MEDLRNPRYTRNNRNNRRSSSTNLNKIINILLLFIILIQSFTIGFLVRNKSENIKEPPVTQGNSSSVVTPVTPSVPATNKPEEQTGTPETVVTNTEASDYTIVCLGDSIFQKSDNNDGIANQLATLTGAKVYNCAISGTQAANINGYDKEIAPFDAFNLSFLVNSITSKDYNLQDTYISEFTALNNGHEAALANLKSIDFMQVDAITIAYGTNDYLNNCTIDNSKSPLDNASTLGALRYAITRIQEYYPHIKIFVLSPPFCYTTSAFNERQTCDELNFGNGTLFDYAANYKQIALDYNVEYIDVLNDSGLNKSNIENYVIDGVHLNSTGKALVGQLIANHIQQGID